MAGTQFVLIEFSMTTPWKEIHEAVNKVLMLGVTPIIAHIERYNALENQEDRVRELINMGCYTQINSAHVLKPRFLVTRIVSLKTCTLFLRKERGSYRCQRYA